MISVGLVFESSLSHLNLLSVSSLILIAHSSSKSKPDILLEYSTLGVIYKVNPES